MNYRNSTFLTQGRVGYKEINKMPQTIALAILGAGAAGTAAAAALTFVIGFGISLAVSWAISALTPQPRAPSRKLMANIRDAAASQEYVYGKVRKGGVVTYVASSGGSSGHRNLYQIIVLAGHPVEEIGTLYVNDGVVTLDGNGDVEQSRWIRDGVPRIRIFKFDGTQTTPQTSAPNNFPDLPDNFIGEGIAYLAVRLSATNGNTWRNGIPLITAEVKGKKVFDPRTGTTAWSDNAALCIRDYLVDERGMDDDGNIDEVTFSAAADVCDARGFKMNGVVNSENPTGNILQDMVTSCAGTLFWGGGKWRLKAGDYTFPVKTFTLDDLRSGITVQTRNSMRDSFNVVQGLFNDAEQRWIEASYPEYFEQEFLDEDNNVRTPLNFNLPLVTDVNQARFLAALTLRRSREQITFSAEFGLEALEVEPGDIVNLDMSRYGWNNKEFEVIDWRLAPSSEAGDLRVAMTLREVSEAAFDPSLPAAQIISNNSELPFNFDTVDPITNLQIDNDTFIATDGTFKNSLIVTWDVDEDDFIYEYLVEWRKVSETEFRSTTTSGTTFTIPNVEDDEEYVVRVTPRNTLGTLGESLQDSSQTLVDTTPPANPTNLSATGEFRAINLSWTNPPDRDFDFVEIWESTTDNINNASQIATAYGTTFYRGNLNINELRYYWIRAVDLSGNKSDFVGSASAVTDFIDDDDFEDGIKGLFQDAGLSAPEIVNELPTTGNFQGRIVFLTTDNKLYVWDGSSWGLVAEEIGVIDFSDIEGQIQSAQIANQAVLQQNIADLAVNADKLAANAVTTAKIADLAVLEAKLAANAVTTAKLANNAVSSAKIADLAVNADKIASSAVTTAKIANSAVSSAKLADGAATEAKIATSAITATKISDNAVTSPKIQAGAVVAGKIAAGAVQAGNIAAGSIVAGDIAAGTITGDRIATNTLTSGNIAAGAITADEIATNAVTAVKINANAVTTAKIAAGAVTAGEIAAGAVTTAKLDALAVTAEKIAAGSIIADKIATNAVTAVKINASAVTADKIATNAVVAEKINAGAVVADKIGANAVTSDKINANAVTAAKIDAGAVTTAKLDALAVTADKIAGNTITGDKIAGNTITGNKIAANTITGGLLATSGIITDSAQIGSAVVDTANIANAAVDTLKIAGQAVTFPQLVAGQVTQTIDLTNTDFVVLASITVVQSGAPAQLTGHINLTHVSDGVIEPDELIRGNLFIKRNGDVHSGIGGVLVSGLNTPSIIVSTQSTFTGEVTYTLEYQNVEGTAESAFISAPRLQFLELKR